MATCIDRLVRAEAGCGGAGTHRPTEAVHSLETSAQPYVLTQYLT